MGLLTKEQIRELIKEKNLVTASDVQEMLKDMFAETLQEMLEIELDIELGYKKNGSKPQKAVYMFIRIDLDGCKAFWECT